MKNKKWVFHSIWTTEVVIVEAETEEEATEKGKEAQKKADICPDWCQDVTYELHEDEVEKLNNGT